MCIDVPQQNRAVLASPSAAGGTADEHVTRVAVRVSQQRERFASLCSPQESNESDLLPIDPAEIPEPQQRAEAAMELLAMQGEAQASNEEANQTAVASLKDFEKLGLLGTGGAAVVYLVRHRASRKLFALKVQQISPMDLQNRQVRTL